MNGNISAIKIHPLKLDFAHSRHSPKLLFPGNFEHDDLGTGAGADGRAPGAHAGGDVKMGLPDLSVACTDLKDGPGDEIERPELAVMGMPRHLQVDLIFGHFRKVIGLVVHHNDRTGGIAAGQQILQALPLFPEHPLPGDVLPTGNDDPGRQRHRTVA